MSRSARASFFSIVSIVLGLFSLGIFAASFFPFTPLKAYIDTFASDGNVDFFSADFYRQLIMRLRLVSLILAIIGLLVWRFRKVLTSFLAELCSSLWKVLTEIPKDIRRWFVRTDAITLWSLGGILCIGIFIRVWFWGRQLYYDEAFTVIEYSSKPLLIAWSKYTEPNNHLLHTFMVRLCMLVMGDGVWSIRLPAFVAGIASLLLVFVLAQSLWGEKVGILAMSLATSSTFLIEYATLARGYSFIVFCFLALWWLAIQVTDDDELGYWALLVVVSVLGCANDTHIPLSVSFNYGLAASFSSVCSQKLLEGSGHGLKCWSCDVTFLCPAFGRFRPWGIDWKCSCFFKILGVLFDSLDWIINVDI